MIVIDSKRTITCPCIVLYPAPFDGKYICLKVSTLKHFLIFGRLVNKYSIKKPILVSIYFNNPVIFHVSRTTRTQSLYSLIKLKLHSTYSHTYLIFYFSLLDMEGGDVYLSIYYTLVTNKFLISITLIGS